MITLKQHFSVNYDYNVYFTENLFKIDNPVFVSALKKSTSEPAKFIVVIDENINKAQPQLCQQIADYAKHHNKDVQLKDEPIIIPGNETIKIDTDYVKKIYNHINDRGIDRHSYIVAIGGGALLDAIGFVAATAHRGIRLIRVPTTILSQDDSGVGVKNGINYFGKKNYIGTFAPPYAVINDALFIKSLGYRDWLSGLAEAIKVSLIKDEKLFNYIHEHTKELKKQDLSVLQKIIPRSAELHLLHIGTQGDPFELGSARPLDFGHWSAHKLEQSTNHRLRHGEAVAIGVALDSTYSFLSGMISGKDLRKILETQLALGYQLYVPELSAHLDNPQHKDSIFKGLIEFQEHLGGELTITMLKAIGKGVEIHEVDFPRFAAAIKFLQGISEKRVIDKTTDVLGLSLA
jgi:3-dehydroquinate synthase